jgi:hypothetical protein
MALDRIEAVTNLLNAYPSVSQSCAAMSAFPWDSDGPSVDMRVTHLINLLEAYLSGSLGPSQIEEWANAVESREDISYFPDSTVGGVIHVLANPTLEGLLSPSGAKEMIASLRSHAN